MAKGKYEKWLTKKKLADIKQWAEDGLTDSQIACEMEISRETFYQWLKKYPDISDTIKKGCKIGVFGVHKKELPT